MCILVVPKIGQRWSHCDNGNPDNLTKFIVGAKLYTFLNSGRGVAVHVYNIFAVPPVGGGIANSQISKCDFS